MQISVRASHSIRLAPERAHVQLSIQHSSLDKQETLERTQRTAADLVSELRRLEAAANAPLSAWTMEHVRTNVVQPIDHQGQRMQAEFTATVDVKVTFADFSEMAEFIADWGGLDGIRIDSTIWDLTPETRQARTDQVLTGAVKAARMRAEVIAAAAGLTKVSVLSVEDTGIPRVDYAAVSGTSRAQFMSAAQGSTPLEFSPEDIDITEEIVARFDAD